MNKLIIFVYFAFIPIFLNAQIQTTTTEKFSITNNTTNTSYLVSPGDTVTIYGYKKKSNVYYFAYRTKDFADVSQFKAISFAVEEKRLKKLPNALSPEMKSFIEEINKEIIAEKALNGEIYIINNPQCDFFKTQSSHGNITKGDTIHILGYSKNGSNHSFALYTNNAYGIFYVVSTNQPFEKQLNTQHLPSIDDTDVRIILKQVAIKIKQKEIEKKKEEIEKEKKMYYADALNGIIKTELLTSSLYELDNKSCPFTYGERVSVLGYSKIDNKHLFAICSENGAGVYNSTTSDIFGDKNIIK